MIQAQTKLTSQCQVSVPASVRRLLGLAPGSTLQWQELDGRIVVQRAVQHDTLAAHQALFGTTDTDCVKPAPKTLAELKLGLTKHIKTRHARA